jgi:hypothetical protein
MSHIVFAQLMGVVSTACVNEQTVHIPAKKSSHILGPVKDDLGLKASRVYSLNMGMWKSEYRTDRSVHWNRVQRTWMISMFISAWQVCSGRTQHRIRLPDWVPRDQSTSQNIRLHAPICQRTLIVYTWVLFRLHVSFCLWWMDKLSNMSASNFAWSSVNLLPKPLKCFMRFLENIL